MPSNKTHIQLYADQCFPVSSVTYLKSLGYSITHANDLKLEGKSDKRQLKESKKLNRVLITLDRDFIYYDQVNLSKHPGVIVISIGSAVPNNINKVCEKVLRNINTDFLKNSLLKATKEKIVRVKSGEVISEKKI